MLKWYVHTKPLSVNKAWKGVRYKTDAYKAYETIVLLRLPRIIVPEPPFKLTLEFGFSNKASDFDNGVKCFVDILQKKYGFNDRDIYEALIRKKIVPKGKEYVSFSLEHFNPQTT
jgi:Holliday junction resolvase RusA-like endonuclease